MDNFKNFNLKSLGFSSFITGYYSTIKDAVSQNLYAVILFTVWVVIILMLSFRVFFSLWGCSRVSDVIKAGNQVSGYVIQNPKLDGIQQKFIISSKFSPNSNKNQFEIITSRYENVEFGDYVTIESGKFKGNFGLIDSVTKSASLNSQNTLYKYTIENGFVVDVKQISREKNLEKGVVTRNGCHTKKWPTKIYYPKFAVDKSKSILILNYVFMVRKLLINKIRYNFSEPVATYILGMTIGVDDDVPSKYLESLRTAGIIHILVVSGYNISLVLTVIFFIFARLSTKVFIFIAILFLFFMITLVGFESPIIRASIMGLIGAYARVSGIQSNSLYLLFVAVIIMLFISPQFIYDIGFQLSTIATFFIILGVNLIQQIRLFIILHEETFNTNPNKKSVVLYKRLILEELLIISFVQIGVLPLISYYFGVININGFISNLFIGWVVSFITILGFIAFLSFSYLTPLLNIIFQILVGYINFIVEAVNDVNLNIEHRLNVEQILIIYLGFIVVYILVTKYLDFSINTKVKWLL